MVSALIAAGAFNALGYSTPPERTIVLTLDRWPVYVPPKYVAEFLDYKVDWSAHLTNDQIVACSAAVVSGDLVVSRTIFDETTMSFWLGGGRSGNGSTLQIAITTAGGRYIDTSLFIRCL